MVAQNSMQTFNGLCLLVGCVRGCRGRINGGGHAVAWPAGHSQHGRWARLCTLFVDVCSDFTSLRARARAITPYFSKQYSLACMSPHAGAPPLVPPCSCCDTD